MTRHRPVPRQPRTAGEWLARAYPRRNWLHADIAERLAHRRPIPTSPPDKSFFGRAFDHAVGLDLAIEPPHPQLLDCLTDTQAHRLLNLAGYDPPNTDPTAPYPLWRKRTSPTSAARLFTAAGRLAHLFQAWRDIRPTTPDNARVVLRPLLAHQPTMYRCQRDIWQARSVLARYWTSYTSGFRDALRSYGAVTVAPALLDGHRSPDLICGNTVVEIKAGRLDQPTYVYQLIDQIVSYALLAPLDGHRVTHVAAYLARYELLIRYPIQDLLDNLAGGPVHAATAATRLAAVIRASESPRCYW